MRKIHSQELKFKVAIEAVKGELTVAQIVSKYKVAASLVHRWRKQLMDNGNKLFSNKLTPKAPDPTEDVQKLHAAIGKLKVEKDFLEHVLSSCQNGSVEL